jgi:hypothetical protein
MLSFGLVWRGLLLVAGIWWCKEIIGRWRDDVEELKTPDWTRRTVILGLWAFTLVVLALIGTFLWGLIANIVRAF